MEPTWDEDYKNDVLEEVTKIGIVVHISVDKVSADVSSCLLKS